jgi:hypothetical protein
LVGKFIIAQFPQRLLQVRYQSSFQVALMITRLALQAQKRQHHRVLDDVAGFCGGLFLAGHGQHGGHVIAQQQALEELTVHLPLHLPGRPVVFACCCFCSLRPSKTPGCPGYRG